MSKSYHIVIEETISEEFTVEAQSKDEAIKKAIESYRNGTFVLSPGSLEHKQLMVEGEDGQLDCPIAF